MGCRGTGMWDRGFNLTGGVFVYSVYIVDLYDLDVYFYSGGRDSSWILLNLVSVLHSTFSLVLFLSCVVLVFVHLYQLGSG